MTRTIAFSLVLQFCPGDKWGEYLEPGKPDKPLTNAICYGFQGKKKIDIVNIGEAYIVAEKGYYFAPISKRSTKDLKHKFSKSFFKAHSQKKTSAIGHETPQQNQIDFVGLYLSSRTRF